MNRPASRRAHSRPTARLLPPRPRAGDWLRAALFTGILLGVAEIGVLWAAGVEMPPALALAVAGGAGLAATPVGVVLALGARWRRVRPSHSALVGAQVGTLVATPALARAAGALGAVDPLGARDAAGLAATLAVAAAAGALGARAGGRLERSGVPLSALLVIGPAALLAALAENGGAAVERLGGPLALGLAVLALAGAGAGLAVVATRRGYAPAPWSWSLAGGIALAAAIAFLPRALPWLSGQADLEALAPVGGPGPMNLLVLDLGERAPVDSGSPWDGPALAILEADSVAYDDVVASTTESVAGALLGADGSGPDLPARLDGRGWATAAAFRSEGRDPGLGVRERDARPGAAALLDALAPQLAGGPLLAALPLSARTALGLGAALRPPEVLGADARRWLVAWRAGRASSPFLLAVDYGAGEPSDPVDPGVADTETGRWLQSLEQLGASERTLLVAGARVSDPAGPSRLALLVRLPLASPGAPRNVRVARPVPIEALRAALALLPDADAARPFALPAVAP